MGDSGGVHFHRTEYVYHAPVSLCYNEARLLPRATAAQMPAEAALAVEPTPRDMRRRTDFFGNAVVFFSIQQPHETLRVTATSQVTVHPQGPRPAAGGDLPWREARRRLAQGRSDPDASTRRLHRGFKSVPPYTITPARCFPATGACCNPPPS